VGVASESVGTDAEWSMELHMTLSVGGTGVTLSAGVPARLVDTGLVIGAFCIRCTLRFGSLFNPDGALKARFADVAGGTGTDGIVVDHLTDGVDSASIHAWVSAFLVETRLVSGTVLVDNALWVNAARHAVDHSALAVATTRRWIAGISWRWRRVFALGERVANEGGRTAADGTVVDDLTLSPVAADARARVHTLVVDTRLVARTVGADDTLGPAAGRAGGALEACETLAHRHTVHHSAQCVGAARRWHTRIHGFCFF